MKNFSLKARLAAFAVILVMAGTALANVGTIHAKWSELMLEEHTELGFVDKNSLPRHYTPGSHQDFDFYFINRENEEVDYSFDVRARANNGKAVVIGSGSGTSAHNIKGVASPEFTLGDMGRKVKIVVELSYQTEEGKQSKTISFWVERQNIPGGQLG